MFFWTAKAKDRETGGDGGRYGSRQAGTRAQNPRNGQVAPTRGIRISRGPAFLSLLEVATAKKQGVLTRH